MTLSRDNDEVAGLQEITVPVLLCDARGHLNPRAVGWTRQPLHTANLRGRGRNKRWEYWAVSAPDHLLAVTVSDLDYAALHAVYFLAPDRTEKVISRLVPLARVALPSRCGAGPVRVRVKDLAIDMDPHAGGVRMRISSPELTADVEITRPGGHEALGVVVPWSAARFQYTVKENTLPVRGSVVADGRTFAFGDDSWATLDHGRGRWPYRVTWNWGSGSGVAGGRTVGLQLGGRWTDGTGSTENALSVDGRLHYVGEDLDWAYDTDDWMRPWRVHAPRSGRVDVTFTPRHVRSDRVNLGILANDTKQVFGTWSGTMVDDDGQLIHVDGIRGWAEQVVNRW